MLPQEKIKPFLLHPIPLVRDFAVHYFYNKNCQSPDLMDWVFRATDRYRPENCTGLLSGARELPLNDGHFTRILGQLKELPFKKQYDLVRRQYEFLLLYAPAAFLRKNAKVLLEDCKLRELHRNIISRFLNLADSGLTSLFHELNNTARSPNIIIDFTNFEYFYGRFLGHQLGLIVDQTFLDEIVHFCADAMASGGWRGILLHEALRSAKFRTDLSRLLFLLGYPVDPVTDAVIFTIRSIGDHRLVDTIFRQFPRTTAQFRSRALEAIVTIKHESIKAHCLGYLAKAKKGERSFLYECLTGLLSEDCLAVLEKGAKKQNYDTQYIDLDETLLIVKIIMAGDLTGESEYSQELAKRNAAKEAQRLETEKLVSRFM
jgi:hypothetical protein